MPGDDSAPFHDAVAALRKIRDDAVAAENHRYTLARRTIDETLRNERITAKLAAIGRLDTAQNTPFTDYSLDLAVNEQTFVTSYNTLYTGYVTGLADAVEALAALTAATVWGDGRPFA